jgi:hypothetical protein
MLQPSKIYFDPYDVDERLAKLGLERETFDTAAMENYGAFVSCTANHPPTAAGFYGWSEMNRSLTDSLLIAKWGDRLDEHNLPLVVNNNRTIAITASSGDQDTGRKDGFPCTSSSKGPCHADLIRMNQHVFEFIEDPKRLAEAVREPGRTTWIFLVHRDFKNSELRYELSRPISMSDDGHVDGWGERIIFPPKPIDPDVRLRRSDRNDTGGQTGEISVEIKKLS